MRHTKSTSRDDGTYVQCQNQKRTKSKCITVKGWTPSDVVRLVHHAANSGLSIQELTEAISKASCVAA